MYTFSRFDNTVVRYIKYRHWSDTLRTRTSDNEEQTFLKGFLNSVTVKVIFLLWMYPFRQFLWLCFHWQLFFFLVGARSFWMSMWYGWWRYLTKVNRRMHRDYKYYLPLRMWGVSESQCRLHTPICSVTFSTLFGRLKTHLWHSVGSFGKP